MNKRDEAVRAFSDGEKMLDSVKNREKERILNLSCMQEDDDVDMDEHLVCCNRCESWSKNMLRREIREAIKSK